MSNSPDEVMRKIIRVYESHDYIKENLKWVYVYQREREKSNRNILSNIYKSLLC
jgi:hypothetical protein